MSSYAVTQTIGALGVIAIVLALIGLYRLLACEVNNRDCEYCE